MSRKEREELLSHNPYFFDEDIASSTANIVDQRTCLQFAYKFSFPSLRMTIANCY